LHFARQISLQSADAGVLNAADISIITSPKIP